MTNICRYSGSAPATPSSGSVDVGLTQLASFSSPAGRGLVAIAAFCLAACAASRSGSATARGTPALARKSRSLSPATDTSSVSSKNFGACPSVLAQKRCQVVCKSSSVGASGAKKTRSLPEGTTTCSKKTSSLSSMSSLTSRHVSDTTGAGKTGRACLSGGSGVSFASPQVQLPGRSSDAGGSVKSSGAARFRHSPSRSSCEHGPKAAACSEQSQRGKPPWAPFACSANGSGRRHSTAPARQHPSPVSPCWNSHGRSWPGGRALKGSQVSQTTACRM